MAQPKAGNNGNVKILSVVWFTVLPPKFGGQKAVALFNEHLAHHAPLTCLCSRSNEKTETSYRVLNSLPVSKTQFFNPFVWRKIYNTAKNQNCTHLLLEFPYHGMAGVLCKKLLRKKLVVNTHNIEFLRFKEQKKKGWQLLRRLEGWTLRNADLVFFKTATDLSVAQQAFTLPPKKLAVMPYGIIKKSTQPQAKKIIRQRHHVKENECLLLFAGTLDYAPNADAVVAMEKKLLPLLNQRDFSYKIIVCGRNRFASFHFLNKIGNDRMIMAGEVENIDAYFAAADVFINPVTSGGGIQTKIMDALSHDLNVVCFASKKTGIEYAENKLFAVEDDNWTAFASAIVSASKKTEATPQSFFENHDWRSIAAQAYEKIAAC